MHKTKEKARTVGTVRERERERERELHFSKQKCSILNKLFNQISNLKIISRNKKKIVIKA